MIPDPRIQISLEAKLAAADAVLSADPDALATAHGASLLLAALGGAEYAKQASELPPVRRIVAGPPMGMPSAPAAATVGRGAASLRDGVRLLARSGLGRALAKRIGLAGGVGALAYWLDNGKKAGADAAALVKPMVDPRILGAQRQGVQEDAAAKLQARIDKLTPGAGKARPAGPAGPLPAYNPQRGTATRLGDWLSGRGALKRPPVDSRVLGAQRAALAADADARLNARVATLDPATAARRAAEAAAAAAAVEARVRARMAELNPPAAPAPAPAPAPAAPVPAEPARRVRNQLPPIW